MAFAHLWQLLTKPADPPPRPRALLPPAAAQTNALVVPATWNEHEITHQLGHARRQSPSMLAYYFTRLKDRFLLNQDHRTAAVRSRFLQQKIEELKLTRDLHGIMNDLAVLAVERDVRVRRLQVERVELESKIQNHARLGGLQLERDRLQLQYDIAVLKRKIREEDNQPTTEQKLTPTQQRALKKAEIEEQLQHLKAEELQAVQRATTELEKRRLQNMYAGRRDQLMEQLEKFL